MRRIAIILTGILIAAGARADAVSNAQAVVSQMSSDVERDLTARSSSSGPISPTPLAFDPLQRAQTNLVSWTRVPSRDELVPRVPTGGMPGRAVIGPGGMVSEYFPRLGQRLTFPANGDTANAIRRMAKGEVSSTPNYCARTVRQALGWGLGDAHDWTALPSRGYNSRPAGTPAQPGDIVVWPFTYGSSNSQHIGIAVGTQSGVRLLSNLSGDLGLTRILPGYRAYWKRVR